MRKLEVVDVAMAVLFLNDNQHSDNIAYSIIDSDLTELGYKGKTPERTVNTKLHDSRRHFKPGDYSSYFRLADRDDVIEKPEVRLALFALRKQWDRDHLQCLNKVEFTFIGDKLVGVRNLRPLISGEDPEFQTLKIPDSVSVEEIKSLPE